MAVTFFCLRKILPYNFYGSIKQKFLEISKREINEKIDLSISYSEIKNERKVEAVKFKIVIKKKQESDRNQVESSSAKKKTLGNEKSIIIIK